MWELIRESGGALWYENERDMLNDDDMRKQYIGYPWYENVWMYTDN